MQRAAAVLISAVLLAGAAREPVLPWLGMGIRSFRDPSGQRFLHVDLVAPGGPAERAGIRPGDIITYAGGAALQVGHDLDFLMFLAQHKPGDRLPLRIVRYGQQRDAVVVFAAMPASVRSAWNQTVDAARRKRLAAAQARAH
jgi:S1-C subfamily serine protease